MVHMYLYVTDLLRETLVSSDEARNTLINGIIAHSHFNDNDQQASFNGSSTMVISRTPEQLGEDVIVGVAYSEDEFGTSHAAQILLEYKAISTMNLSFHHCLIFYLYVMAFSVIEKNVFIWQMAKPARRNEPLIIRAIFQYHPQLSTSGLKIVEWQTKNDHDEYPTIEGGDVAYLGQGVLLIGCSERTNRAGIEALARTGLFHQVIAVVLPPKRDYMHLDTVLSSVGKHAFTLHGPLANIMEVFTVATHDDNNNLLSKPKWISHGCDVRQALRKLLNDPELIFYDALDEETSIVEQRECRHNVFVIDDYHVVTYAGGDSEKGIVTEMTRNNDCRVGLIPY